MFKTGMPNENKDRDCTAYVSFNPGYFQGAGRNITKSTNSTTSPNLPPVPNPQTIT